MNESLVDPMIHINHQQKIEAAEKKMESAANRKKVAEKKQEAVKQKEDELALKWMIQFESMHQERKTLTESNALIRIDVAAKAKEITCLRDELKNSQKQTDNALRLLRQQQNITRKQQDLIDHYSKVNRRLRILNNHKKKVIRGLVMTFDKTSDKQATEKLDE